MLSALNAIWNAVKDVAYLVVGFWVEAINGAIVGVGALAGFLIALLPSFPEPPSAPGGVLGFLNWVIPLGPALSIFSIFTGLWVSFLAVKAGLKWVKAL